MTRIDLVRIARSLAAAPSFLALGCAGNGAGEPVATDAGAADTRPAPGRVSAGDNGTKPPGGDGGTPTPKACTSEGECAGACPSEAKGCTCAQTPEGNLCIPTCTTDQDCPARPEGALVCSAQKTCTPKS